MKKLIIIVAHLTSILALGQQWSGRTTVSAGAAGGHFVESKKEFLHAGTLSAFDLSCFCSVNRPADLYEFQPSSTGYGLLKWGLHRRLANGRFKRAVLGGSLQVGVGNNGLQSVPMINLTGTARYQTRLLGIGLGVGIGTPVHDLTDRDDPMEHLVTLAPELQLGLLDWIYLDFSMNRNAQLVYPQAFLGFGTGFGSIDGARMNLGLSLNRSSVANAGSLQKAPRGWRVDLALPLSDKIILETSFTTGFYHQWKGIRGYYESSFLFLSGTVGSGGESIVVQPWHVGSVLRITLD